MSRLTTGPTVPSPMTCSSICTIGTTPRTLEVRKHSCAPSVSSKRDVAVDDLELLGGKLQHPRADRTPQHAGLRREDAAVSHDVDARGGRLGDDAAAVVEQVHRALVVEPLVMSQPRQIAGGLGLGQLAGVLDRQQLGAGLVDRGGHVEQLVGHDEERGRRRVEVHPVGRGASGEHQADRGFLVAVSLEQLVDDRDDLVVGERNVEAQHLRGVAEPGQVLSHHERPAVQRLQQVEDRVAAQQPRVER